jgi:pilus assembly protein CpaB
MNAVRIAILAVAAVAAVGLALLLRNMATGSKHAPAAVAAVAPVQATARVLVAANDLAVGARLTASDMTWQPWPAEGLSPNYITDGAQPAPKTPGAEGAASSATKVAKDIVTGGGPAMQAMVGSVVKDAFNKGEPIVARKIVRAGEGGYLSVVLKPGMRAMALPVSADTSAGGFIQPGDRVDLLESHQDSGRRGGPGYVSQIVVSNVRVLAVDQTTDAAKNGKSIVGATITLEVPAGSAQPIAEAKARGGIMMALRSYADIAGGAGGVSGAAGNEIRVIKGGQQGAVTVLR